MSRVILTNGHIHLFDQHFTIVDSLIIDGEFIVDYSNQEQRSPLANSDTEIVDLEGRTVLPGLIDAHIHFASYAMSFTQIDCETLTLEEALERIRNQIDQLEPGQWILGHGWNQNLWSRFGTAQDLDSITCQHPVYLTAKSGHAAWVNSFALKVARCNASTQDPHGGKIQRDEHGHPTGILFEEAMQLVSQYIPEPSDGQVIRAMAACQERLWHFGITGIHDFNGVQSFRSLQALRQENKLGLRVLKIIPYKNLNEVVNLGIRSGFGDHWLRIGQIKLFADGALGPQTAAMIDPYCGDENNSGILLFDKEQLSKVFLNAFQAQLGLSIHAIGDRANRMVLDTFHSLRSVEVHKNSPLLRHRIEHLQLLHPEDLYRPAKLGLIASMQPFHATSDMDMANQHWGNRSRFAYAWHSLLQTGMIMAFGSDAPVENPNPFWGLHAAVTRRRLDGSPDKDGWIPEERITLPEAFMAYTYGPAYAAGLEKLQGKLLPGFLADLIVLDVDPFRCPSEQLPHLLPVATMVAGQWRIRNF